MDTDTQAFRAGRNSSSEGPEGIVVDMVESHSCDDGANPNIRRSLGSIAYCSFVTKVDSTHPL